jgi:hypothetical protein
MLLSILGPGCSARLVGRRDATLDGAGQKSRVCRLHLVNGFGVVSCRQGNLFRGLAQFCGQIPNLTSPQSIKAAPKSYGLVPHVRLYPRALCLLDPDRMAKGPNLAPICTSQFTGTLKSRCLGCTWTVGCSCVERHSDDADIEPGCPIVETAGVRQVGEAERPGIAQVYLRTVFASPRLCSDVD